MEDFIFRAIQTRFASKLNEQKVMLLLGARRVGKTVFIKEFLKTLPNEKILELNGEDITVLDTLTKRSVENYRHLIGENTLLFIDEAQKIPEIGLVLKLMIDNFPSLKIIATGSSVFDLSNKTGEPLTGRKITFNMFPLAQMEFSTRENLIVTKANIEERLIYGGYPELVHYKNHEDKQLYLKELVNSYLLKDILEFENIKNSSKMFNLLRLIAFQIGKEVSLEELGKQLGLSRNTVEKYLDLLEKVFILYKLSGFSRNLRKEIVKSNRYYFYDTGIRNTLIANFNSINFRNDIGELWENYVLMERVKVLEYKGVISNNYFWRTYEQQEIDWIEERNGNLFAYEIKWTNKKVKVPTAWKSAYPESEFNVITQENYLDWIEFTSNDIQKVPPL